VRVYFLCEACGIKVRSLGQGKVADPQAWSLYKNDPMRTPGKIIWKYPKFRGDAQRKQIKGKNE
jgi:hypothetical protein